MCVAVDVRVSPSVWLLVQLALVRRTIAATPRWPQLRLTTTQQQTKKKSQRGGNTNHTRRGRGKQSESRREKGGWVAQEKIRVN